MSVEKIITYEEIPYFQLYTNVVQNINNMQAGWVWVYLMSKPRDWDVIKAHLKNKFKIGNDKLKKIFAYLHKHRLIEYISHKDEKGKFIRHETKVLNGSKFLTDEQVNELSTQHVSSGVEIHPVDNQSIGSGPLHIKESTNERKSITCPAVAGLAVDIGDDDEFRADEVDRFHEFYEVYPRKEQKLKAERAWNKGKLNEIADAIIAKVIERNKLDYSHREKKHVPLPATYLNGLMWQDEITPHGEDKKMSVNKNVQNVYRQETGYASVESQSTSWITPEESIKRDREYQRMFERSSS
jgi:hypothetical protein